VGETTTEVVELAFIMPRLRLEALSYVQNYRKI